MTDRGPRGFYHGMGDGPAPSQQHRLYSIFASLPVTAAHWFLPSICCRFPDAMPTQLYQKSAIAFIVNITLRFGCYSLALTPPCARFSIPITSKAYQQGIFLHNTMSKRNYGKTHHQAKSNGEQSHEEACTQYFLLKSEPSDYSISDLERDNTEEWNGIRNYQARNFLRTMKVGDRAFFYHSKAATPAMTGIVGTCRISREAQPDASALDPKSEYFDAKCTKEKCKWDTVLVEYEQTFPVVLSLKEMKEIASNDPTGLIAGLALLKQSRLSVVPLDREQWIAVMGLIDDKIARLEGGNDLNHDTKELKKQKKK